MRYKLTIAVALAMFSPLSSTQAQPELHVIMACDTAHPQYGEAFDINLLRLKSVLLTNVATHQLRITALRSTENEPLSKARLLSAVREAQVDSDDTLILYIACASTPEERQGESFRFARTEEPISRNAVRHWIMSRNIRLGGLLTDSCVDYHRMETRMTAISAIGPARLDTKPLFRSLFFESQGMLDWAASAPDEYALCYDNYAHVEEGDAESLSKNLVLGQHHYDGIPTGYEFNYGRMYLRKSGEQRKPMRGGLFTESIAESLTGLADKPLSWATFLAAVQQQLDTAFLEESRGGLIFVQTRWVRQKKQSIRAENLPTTK